MSTYIHNKQNDNSGKLAVLLSYASENKDLSKDFANQLCMHIAAMSPQSIDEKGIILLFLQFFVFPNILTCYWISQYSYISTFAPIIE